MGKTTAYENLIKTLNPHKEADKAWFLELLDTEKQKSYEDGHMAAVMQMLRISHIREHKIKIMGSAGGNQAHPSGRGAKRGKLL